VSNRPNSRATQEPLQFCIETIRRKQGHGSAVTTTGYLHVLNPEIDDGISRDDSLERADVLNTQEKMA